MTEIHNSEALTLAEIVASLDGRTTKENILARVHRGSLSAFQDENGTWFIPQDELERLLAEVEPCHNCEAQATSYVIVKYHQHHRVEFSLCEECAQQAHAAYSRKGGVLEVVVYPLLGEGWLKP